MSANARNLSKPNATRDIVNLIEQAAGVATKQNGSRAALAANPYQSPRPEPSGPENSLPAKTKEEVAP
jgi:hypothetical protein